MWMRSRSTMAETRVTRHTFGLVSQKPDWSGCWLVVTIWLWLCECLVFLVQWKLVKFFQITARSQDLFFVYQFCSICLVTQSCHFDSIFCVPFWWHFKITSPWSWWEFHWNYQHQLQCEFLTLQIWTQWVHMTNQQVLMGTQNSTEYLVFIFI